MKKYFLFIVVFLFNNIYSMNLEKQEKDVYSEFQEAIITSDQEKVKELLKPTIQLNVCLDKGSSALEIALENPSIEMAQFLVKKIKSKLSKAEAFLYDPFQQVGGKGDVTLLHRLMSLDIPTRLKKIGCDLALSSACSNNHVQLVQAIVTNYPKYIENPITCSFEWATICFPEKHHGLIQAVLQHPKAKDTLEQMINNNNLVYQDRKECYKQLLSTKFHVNSI